MKKYLIIADDFTGANDTGVQLANVGINVGVRFSVSQLYMNSTVLDTETRNDSNLEATSKFEGMISHIDFGRFDEVFKKIDSTLRGNIATELRILSHYYKPELIIFTPSLPDLHRTVSDGVLYVNNQSAMGTDFAKDPLKPIRTDKIKDVLQSAFPDKNIEYFNLKQIRQPSFQINPNNQLYAFDAETNFDLVKIITATKKLNKRVLWVGSSGLMSALLTKTFKVQPSLALIGSVSEVTRRQLRVAEKNGVKLVNIPIYEVYKQQSYQKYINEALDAFSEGQDVILMSSASYRRSELQKTIDILEQDGFSSNKVNELTQTILSGICRKVLKEIKVSGLLVSGGETAKGLLKIAKANGARVISEITPGVPLLEIEDGELDGLRMITKAGAFGEENLILYAFKKLKCQSP